jgi:hypothetical protein
MPSVDSRARKIAHRVGNVVPQLVRALRCRLPRWRYWSEWTRRAGSTRKRMRVDVKRMSCLRIALQTSASAIAHAAELARLMAALKHP